MRCAVQDICDERSLLADGYEAHAIWFGLVHCQEQFIESENLIIACRVRHLCFPFLVYRFLFRTTRCRYFGDLKSFLIAERFISSRVAERG
jgi:hypothetical protein